MAIINYWTILFVCSFALVLGGKVQKKNLFHIHAVERGTPVDDVIEIDLVKNTETFWIPPHNDIDGATIINDFNRNLSLHLSNGTGTCLLHRLGVQELEQETVLPGAMLDALNFYENQGPIKEPTKILREWTIGERVQDKQGILSAEMLDLCDGHDTFWMERQHESMEITGINDVDHSGKESRPRSKRSWANVQTSVQGSTYTRCIMDFRSAMCNVITRHCHRIVMCEVNYDQYPPTTICNHVEHILDTMYCCQNCCDEEDRSDSVFPFCLSLTEEDISC